MLPSISTSINIDNSESTLTLLAIVVLLQIFKIPSEVSLFSMIKCPSILILPKKELYFLRNYYVLFDIAAVKSICASV